MSSIIFDFDGTIADSLPFAIKMFNDWAKHRQPISDEELQKLREMPLQNVIVELKVPTWKIPSLLYRARKEMTKHLHEVPMFSGMKEVIEQLNKANIDLYIVSSNGNKNIYKFLKINNMENSFKKVYGGIGLRGKAKALKSVVKRNNIDPSKTYYIGDETRDVNDAKSAGLRTVSVTWGYNGKKILSEQKPEHIVEKPNELPKILIG
jgi:HAD superfamily hydrolase (TIGR01549 family)